MTDSHHSAVSHGTRIGIVFALIAMALYAVGDAALKYALSGVTIFFALAVFDGTGATCSALALIKGRHPFIPKSKRFVFVYGALFTGEMLTFLVALDRLPFAECFVIILLTPLVTAVVARFTLGEARTMRQYLCLVSALCGVGMMLFMPGLVSGDHGALLLDPLGVIACAGNIFFNTAKMIWMRRFGQNENPATISLYQQGMVCCVMIPFVTLEGANVLIILALIGGGILGFIGNWLYIRSFQMAEASIIAPTQFSQMIWVALMGSMLFHEPLTLSTLIGAALVVGSGLLFYCRVNAKSGFQPSDDNCL